MASMADIYSQMKTFLDFTEDDAQRLTKLEALFATEGPGITDRFYKTLMEHDETRKLVEGRVDKLKLTHKDWMAELFAGEYGEDYLNKQVRVGQVHVRIGLEPQFVEGVMNHLRREGVSAIYQNFGDIGEASALSSSLMKVLDLNLLVINLAYADERLNRLESITGMRRKLIENLIKQGNKKKAA